MVSEGVLGVRCQGETGTRRFGFEAPGRARPACSLCSIICHFRSKHRAFHCENECIYIYIYIIKRDCRAGN